MKSSASYAVGPWPFGPLYAAEGFLSFIRYDQDKPVAAIAFESFGSFEDIVEVVAIEVMPEFRRKGIMTNMIDTLRSNGITPVISVQQNNPRTEVLSTFLQTYYTRDQSLHNGKTNCSFLSAKGKLLYTLGGDEIEDEGGYRVDPWKSLLCSIR